MFSDPHDLIEQFELQSGARVVDLGAGSGELAIAAARVVGEAGRVYAIEVQQGLVERLKSHAKEARVQNVETLWGDIERLQGTHLKDGTADAAFASNVLFQVEDRPGFVAEVNRILKPGGRLLVVDWTDSFNNLPAPRASRQAGMGPHPDHIVTEKAARELLEQGGFQFVKKIVAGEHHYGMIFRKA